MIMRQWGISLIWYRDVKTLSFIKWQVWVIRLYIHFPYSLTSLLIRIWTWCNIDWPPVSSDHQVPQDPCSGETGKLCKQICSSVSILAIVLIAALIGHSDCKPKYLHPIMWKFAWIAIWPMFVVEYFPQFWGNWKWLSLQSVRVHSRDYYNSHT